MRRRFQSLLVLGALLPFAGAFSADLAPGLVGEYFSVRWLASDFPTIPSTLQPTVKRVDPQIDFPWVSGPFYETKLVDRFYVRWSGLLRAPSKGRYTLYTESDDGSRVLIKGVLVVNNYGLHAMQEEEGDVELDAGDNEIVIDYVQYDGGAGMELFWKVQGGEKVIVPKEALWHNPAEEGANVETLAASTPRPKVFTETVEPPETATLDEKVASVLPRPGEDLWLQIPWRRNLHAARLESQATGKPLFLWVMNGDPLGCT